MLCTIGGAPVAGCCEGRTTFIPGFIGQAQVSIQAALRGAAADGIMGADLYIEGLEQLPGDWLASASAAASSGVEGNLVAPSDLDGDGVADDRVGRVRFRSCRSEPALTVATLTVWSHDALEDLDMTTLRLVSGSPPGDPDFGCPLLVLCDAPVFTKICVEESVFDINSTAFQLPNTPWPADKSAGVPPNTRLCWQQELSACLESSRPEIHFGTQPNPTWVACELDQAGNSVCCDPGPLLPNTTYYWRVLVPLTGRSPAPWSFTTGDNVAAMRSTWGGVKHLYR